MSANIDGELNNIKIIVPLKTLSHFSISLDFLMINMEIGLILKWSQNCIIDESAKREEEKEKMFLLYYMLLMQLIDQNL